MRATPAMATYSFPALGFDPAPGDPDAIEAVARECQRCARDLSADADQLRRLTQHVDWQGGAADAFAAHPAQLHDDLGRASDAQGGTGAALASYAAVLRQAQIDARRLEQDAAEAKARADRHAAEVDRLAHSISTAPADADTADQAARKDAARRLHDHAQDDYQHAVTHAHAVERTQQEAGDRAASRIRALSDAPYHQPGLLSRMVDSVGDWVDKHADLLREISNVLKAVSAIAGLLSFIPALTPIFGPIAALTAGGALVIDAALVATGHGDWKALVFDAALMALPGAGRIVSRAKLASRAQTALTASTGQFARLDKQGLAALGWTKRPPVAAALSTRSRGPNVFTGASGGPTPNLHPLLQEALDKVPASERSIFHGQCAEIKAINKALQSEARLRGGVMKTAKVRSPRNPQYGMPHPPCSSCHHVLEQWEIDYVR
jgi:YwqJ-like deaminase